MSKTLDQSGAEFAASALVTVDQLLTFKSKEELVLASGVNGVLTNAGEGMLTQLSLHNMEILGKSVHLTKYLKQHKSVYYSFRNYSRVASTPHWQCRQITQKLHKDAIYCSIVVLIALEYAEGISNCLGLTIQKSYILVGKQKLLSVQTGVFKGLHLSTTTAALHQTNQSTHTTTSAAPTFLQPSSNSATPSPVNAVPTSLSSNPSAHAAATAPQQLGLLGCNAATTSPATTQVLIGNNICLSVPSAASLAGRHIPRTLGNVPPTALKLSAATNMQIPKVSGATSMDMSSRFVFVVLQKINQFSLSCLKINRMRVYFQTLQ